MAQHNTWLDTTPVSVFDHINTMISNSSVTPFYNLHQGKTTFPPLAQPKKWSLNDFDLLAHHHASANGVPSLRSALCKKFNESFNKEISEDRVTVTNGATHAVGIALRSVLYPGDEVLILSPQWLFAVGLVRAAGCVPIEVPVFHKLSQDSSFDFISLLESYITPRTRAIYFNNPNNPTGTSLYRAGLQRLAEFAHIHDLWIIADNAYENYDFTSEGFTDIAELAIANERAFSVYTFSKMYAIPGYRVGYVLSPTSMAEHIRKLCLYSIYSVSTSSQFGAFQALQTPKSTLQEYHLLAKQARDIVAEQLQIPSTYAEGGIYVFLDLSKWAEDIDRFISMCIARGVALVPGYAFGTGYDKYARICFTATDHEGLRDAIDRINNVYIENI
jgi:aspartate aminotransferase